MSDLVILGFDGQHTGLAVQRGGSEVEGGAQCIGVSRRGGESVAEDDRFDRLDVRTKG